MGSCAGEIPGLELYFQCGKDVLAPLLAPPQTSFMRLQLPVFSAQGLGFYVVALWILQLKTYLAFDPPAAQMLTLHYL